VPITFYGRGAGFGTTTGSDNTMIGTFVGDTGNFSNTIIIGTGPSVVPNKNHHLRIGTSTSDPGFTLIDGDMSIPSVQIHGQVILGKTGSTAQHTLNTFAPLTPSGDPFAGELYIIINGTTRRIPFI